MRITPQHFPEFLLCRNRGPSFDNSVDSIRWTGVVVGSLYIQEQPVVVEDDLEPSFSHENEGVKRHGGSWGIHRRRRKLRLHPYFDCTTYPTSAAVAFCIA
ncbi:hypothetical protein Nepgr_020978 [Nepenthes gracilis]|uniref:Uncharacterized protein n=1 Tax=Nepenthes gracilis TaxID=150966 RepID=A0AAD3XVJ6_NEPGR|nr:hypothetical protein Nepgr_020978 [Nepenthes gracilis]